MTKKYEIIIQRYNSEGVSAVPRVVKYREDDGHFTLTVPSREGERVIEELKGLCKRLKSNQVKFKLEIDQE